MNQRFIRTEMMLGAGAMDKLRGSHVAVFGLGGVGSYAVEALCRSGVGELTLIDQDTLSRLRGKCVNDVKRLNGRIDFEDAVKYQKGDD